MTKWALLGSVSAIAILGGAYAMRARQLPQGSRSEADQEQDELESLEQEGEREGEPQAATFDVVDSGETGLVSAPPLPSPAIQAIPVSAAAGALTGRSAVRVETIDEEDDPGETIEPTVAREDEDENGTVEMAAPRVPPKRDDP